MENYCVESDRSSFLADALEKIPRSDQDAKLILELCPSTEKENSTCVGCILSLITFLQVCHGSH